MKRSAAAPTNGERLTAYLGVHGLHNHGRRFCLRGPCVQLLLHGHCAFAAPCKRQARCYLSVKFLSIGLVLCEQPMIERVQGCEHEFSLYQVFSHFVIPAAHTR
jgi:hypothetical protein